MSFHHTSTDLMWEIGTKKRFKTFILLSYQISFCAVKSLNKSLRLQQMLIVGSETGILLYWLLYQINNDCILFSIILHWVDYAEMLLQKHIQKFPKQCPHNSCLVRTLGDIQILFCNCSDVRGIKVELTFMKWNSGTQTSTKTFNSDINLLRVETRPCPA